jgi:porin
VGFHLNPNAGLIFINEFEFDFFRSEPEANPTRRGGHWFFGPGRILVGGFYTTDRFADIYEAQLKDLGVANTSNRVREIPGDYGIYLVWEQKCYEDAPGSENGFYLFARGSVLPADRNFTSESIEAGAVYKGIFRRQTDTRDSLGLGFGYNNISTNVRHANDVARKEGVADIPHLDFESVLEATYVLPINSHWQLQPDLQWVIHPGASDQFHNAVVLGLRSIITF